jgi:cell division protein FtsZ
MLGMGYAMMGTASASGEGAAVIAAQKAISSPLLEAGGVRGARGVLINITGSSRLGLHEVNEACTLIRTAAENEDVQINFGVVLNEASGDEVKITVIATGFERDSLPAIQRRHQVAAAAAGAGAASSAPAPAPRVEEPAPAPQMTFLEPEPAPAVEEPAAPEPVHAEAPQDMPPPPHVNGHEQRFDDLDVPAIVRRRMVQ